jgi:hypothetical protein
MVKFMRKVEANLLPLISPREPERHDVHVRLESAGQSVEDLILKD